MARELDYLLSVTADTTGIRTFTTALNQAKATAQRFGIQVSQSAKLSSVRVTETLDKQKNVVKNFRTVLVDGNRRIRASFQQTAKGIKPVGASVANIGKQAKTSKPFIDNFTKALRRVAIVVPVWLLFRSALLGVINTIQQGAQAWIEFDKALQRSVLVINGATGGMQRAIDNLTERVRQLAIDTGKSMKDVTDAFFRFGTVGIEYEDALEGMATATRLATTLFGDAEQTATVLAQTYRLLGDSIDQSIPPQERIRVIGAQILELYRDNAFTLNEFNESLLKFLPTANAFNFSIDESVALLATLNTAGLKAGRAGRLLRTSINKLVSNLGELAGELGVVVNPELESTFDVLLKVLKAVKDLQEAGGELPIEAFEQLGLFGGVRAREAGLALVTIYDTLIDNFDRINLQQRDYNELLAKENEEFLRVQQSLGVQTQRFDRLRTLAGQAFVRGIVGGKDFEETLGRVNAILENSLDFFERLGQGLVNLSVGIVPFGQAWLSFNRLIEEKAIKNMDTLSKITEGLQGKIPLEELDSLIQKIEEGSDELKNFRFEAVGLDEERILASLRATRARLQEEAEREPVEVPAEIDLRTDVIGEGGELLVQIRSELERQINTLREEVTLFEIRNQNIKESIILEEELKNIIRTKVQRFNESKDVQEGQLQAIDEQRAITLALVGDYERLLGLFLQANLQEKEILEIEKQRAEIAKARVKEEEDLTEQLLKHELDLLKARGLSSSELIKAKVELERLLGLNQDAGSELQNQLDLQKAITGEMTKQKNLSSETIKLFQIAQRFGVNIAKEIGEVITGTREIGDLSRRALNVFQRQFSGRFTQFQAREFFTGAGAGIPTPDTLGAGNLNEILQRIRTTRAQQIFRTELPISAQVNINVNASELRNNVRKEVDRALTNSDIKKIIEDYYEKNI